jgi:hypothetical protein
MLQKQLPASAAWHQSRPGSVDTGESDQPSASAGVQRGYQSALGAEAGSVGGVLHIATGDYPPVIDERRGTHRKAGIRRVRVLAGLSGCGSELVPVDGLAPFDRRRPELVEGLRAHWGGIRAHLYGVRAHGYFSKGMPSAAGGLTRPTRPATAMIVATYGKINKNWLGIGVLKVCSCEAI